MTAGALVADARKAAGLTQAELAQRLGTTQSAIARLERATSRVRLDSVDRALRACGRSLRLVSEAPAGDVDETLLSERLRLTPAERLKSFERSYGEVRKLALAGRRARGELA
jgi:transcriptional regulator with XRE-family HTH domain